MDYVDSKVVPPSLSLYDQTRSSGKDWSEFLPIYNKWVKVQSIIRNEQQTMAIVPYRRIRLVSTMPLEASRIYKDTS